MDNTGLHVSHAGTRGAIRRAIKPERTRSRRTRREDGVHMPNKGHAGSAFHRMGTRREDIAKAIHPLLVSRCGLFRKFCRVETGLRKPSGHHFAYLVHVGGIVGEGIHVDDAFQHGEHFRFLIGKPCINPFLTLRKFHS